MCLFYSKIYYSGGITFIKLSDFLNQIVNFSKRFLRLSHSIKSSLRKFSQAVKFFMLRKRS